MSYEAHKKYEKKCCKRYNVKFNNNNEMDKVIIQFLESEDFNDFFLSKQSFFREACFSFVKKYYIE